MKRGASGKAMEVELMTSKNCYRIYKELVIRRVFQKNGVSLPSANIIIDNKKDNYGNITDVVINGGGFGHGIGMSQNAARRMAQAGYDYKQILQFFYECSIEGVNE